MILNIVGGEQILPAGGSCLLGSINLSEFVLDPFTVKAQFNTYGFAKVVEESIIALNEVLHEGLSLHPLEEQRISVNDWRQVGLGIFGWHDCLIKMGIRYGSEESISIANEIGSEMINFAVKASAELTAKYGKFPKYNEASLFKSKFFQENVDSDFKSLVKEKGMANSALLTIAPTGSIGTMLGVSTGMEPIFAHSYTRKTESLHGEDVYYKVFTPVIEKYINLHNIQNEKDLPDFINSAMDIDYKERIEMQSAWQKYIDASISSTINLPNSATVEDIENIYMLAWEQGLKGVTVYRDGCAREGILSTEEKKEETPENNGLEWGTTIQSTDDLIGRKRRIVTGCGSLHVQGWFDPVSGKLMELFLSKGSSGVCNSFAVSLSRVISAGLRTGLGFDYAMEQLKSVPVCASYSVRSATKKDTSKGNCCPAAIANALIEMQEEVFSELLEDEEIKENGIPKLVRQSSNKCTECGEPLSFQGGCLQCSACGWSKCE